MAFRCTAWGATPSPSGCLDHPRVAGDLDGVVSGRRWRPTDGVDGSMMVDVAVMAATVRPDADPDHPVRARDSPPTRRWAAAPPTCVGWRTTNRIIDNGRVTSALTIRRVQSDVEVLARAGLDTATFIEEFLEFAQPRRSARRRVCRHARPSDPPAHRDLQVRRPATATTITTSSGPSSSTANPTARRSSNSSSATSPPGAIPQATDRDRPDPVAWCEPATSSTRRTATATNSGWPARQGTVGWGAVALFRGADEPTFSATDTEFLGHAVERLRRRPALGAAGPARRPTNPATRRSDLPW